MVTSKLQHGWLDDNFFVVEKEHKIRNSSALGYPQGGAKIRAATESVQGWLRLSSN